MGEQFMGGLDKTKARLTLLAGVLTGLFACLLLATLPASAQTISFNSARNCDNNAVIDCGALTVAELQQKFNATPSVRTIFGAFNISPQDIATMTSDTACTVSSSTTTATTTANATMLCSGTVSKTGTVMVNGQTVATNAVTAGRQNIAGSTQMTVGGVTFFERPPSVSFVSDNLDAFVIMNNGQFQSAILASCGNPVKATPVVKPAAKPAPKPAAATAAAPTPPMQQQQQQQQVVVVQQPVQTQTVVQQAPAPQPQSLPSTGPGSYIGLFAGTSILGTAAARFFLKRRPATSSPLEIV